MSGSASKPAMRWYVSSSFTQPRTPLISVRLQVQLGEDIVGIIRSCDVELLKLTRPELDELLQGMLVDMQVHVQCILLSERQHHIATLSPSSTVHIAVILSLSLQHARCGSRAPMAAPPSI